MLTYFVPITLMVLAGFLLGLLVGRVAWATSSTRRDHTPIDTDGRPEPESDDATDTEGGAHAAKPEPEEASQDQTVGSLPVWEMEEVVPIERQGSNMPPIK